MGCCGVGFGLLLVACSVLLRVGLFWLGGLLVGYVACGELVCLCFMLCCFGLELWVCFVCRLGLSWLVLMGCLCLFLIVGLGFFFRLRLGDFGLVGLTLMFRL